MSDDQALIDTLPMATLTAEDVRRIWSERTGLDPAADPDAWEACEDAILGTLDPDRGLQMRPGGWTVDLTTSVVRVTVASGLIAACMWPAGLDQLPAFVLPQVLPLLFDIRKARLTRSDNEVLLHLRLNMTTEQMDYPWPGEALYQRLPQHLRDTISPADFDDFVTRLVQVGEADGVGYDEVRIRPSGKARWLRVSIRR